MGCEWQQLQGRGSEVIATSTGMDTCSAGMAQLGSGVGPGVEAAQTLVDAVEHLHDDPVEVAQGSALGRQPGGNDRFSAASTDCSPPRKIRAVLATRSYTPYACADTPSTVAGEVRGARRRHHTGR